MNVYVESNFVLELALLQEQSSSCEEVLRLAESGRIRLILPAYALIEPYETLVRRRRDRKRIGQELSNELKQIARNKELKSQLDGLIDITSLLVRTVDEDEKRLNSVRSRLLQFACVIPMGASVLRAVEKYGQEQELAPQDAHIYSAIVGHLKQNEDSMNCFLNKDRKDFGEQGLVDELKNYNCKLLPSFDKGRDYVRKAI